MKRNILFLDYDGVVNTPIWDESGTRCCYGSPMNNKVNNFQAVQWVSEFCQKFQYDIVVTSTWRFGQNYAKCLVNGGLRNGIQIVGRTPYLGTKRGEEIKAWLNEHPEVENYIIFDDDADMGDILDHLVQCDACYGFGLRDFKKAETLHNSGKTKKEKNNGA